MKAKPMKKITVHITERDGRRWDMDVLASSTAAACMTVLSNLGRIVKVCAEPSQTPPEAA